MELNEIKYKLAVICFAKLGKQLQFFRTTCRLLQPNIIQPKVQSDAKYLLLNRYYVGERHHKGFPDLVTHSLELNGGGNGYCMGES